jgi:hypothetical protein
MPHARPGGLVGFSMADRVAVREVVERQSPLRREICRLLAMGYSQREAAEALGMSRRRVCRHVAALRRAFVKAGFEDFEVRQRRARRRTRWQLTLLERRRRIRRAARRRMMLAYMQL